MTINNKEDVIYLENDCLLPIFIVKNKQWSELIDLDVSINFGMSIQNGFANGYVCIPSWHPYYLKNYTDIPVNVHGGLSFSAYDKQKNMWVIGFDTFHYNDNINNCSFDFVKEQTFFLREQCMNIKEVQRFLKIKKILNKKNE